MFLALYLACFVCVVGNPDLFMDPDCWLLGYMNNRIEPGFDYDPGWIRFKMNSNRIRVESTQSGLKLNKN